MVTEAARLIDERPSPERSSRAPRQPVVPNGALAMLLFIICEAMFYAGMISAFTIARANALPGMWPPPDQPRLPAASTAFNTAALLLSAPVLLWAYRQYKRSAKNAKHFLLAAALLGATFVVLQGVEWVALLKQGLTLVSSTMGSFFYLIVGTHALHAVIALALLFVVWVKLSRTPPSLSTGWFLTAQTFWLFVVGLWPIIYLRVYF